MGLFDSIGRLFTSREALLVPQPQNPYSMPSQPRVMSTKSDSIRSFEAGITDRLTASWTTQEFTVNQDLYRYLRVMRARSREFCQNVELGRKFVNLMKVNIVGPQGFALSVDARNPDGTLDRADALRIETAFTKWALRGNCDMSGKHSFTELQHIIIASVVRDGEVMVRKVRGSNAGIHKFALQILPAYLLDENHNLDLPNGNKIRLGIEMNAFDKPLAYHIRDNAQDVTGVGTQYGQSYTRIPADEIYHLFVSDEASQFRGFPWGATALRRARHLDQFEESAMVAAHVGASKSGFFTRPDSDEDAAAIADDIDDSGEFITDAVAGAFGVLPQGYDFKSFDPAYPSEIYTSFVATISRSIATGLNVSAATLTGDLTDVNYSSIRAGTISERESFEMIQGWMINAFMKPLFADWLISAMMNDADLKLLPVYRYDKFNSPSWQGRRWLWIDPQSEMTANTDAVALGVKSRADIIRSMGGDPERVFAEIDSETKRFGPVTPVKAPPTK